MADVAAAMATEEDIVCEVCLDGFSDGDHCNAILLCDGCDLAVHQQCYGVIAVPADAWYCHSCISLTPTHKRTACALCPTTDRRATKPIHNSGSADTTRTAHLACALWHPQVSLADPYSFSPIIIDRVDASCFSATCEICGVGGKGACVECACGRFFHVTCAQTNAAKLQGYLPANCPSCAWQRSAVVEQALVADKIASSKVAAALQPVAERLRAGGYALHPCIAALNSLAEPRTVEEAQAALKEVEAMAPVAERRAWLMERVGEMYHRVKAAEEARAEGHSKENLQNLHNSCQSVLKALLKRRGSAEGKDMEADVDVDVAVKEILSKPVGAPSEVSDACKEKVQRLRTERNNLYVLNLDWISLLYDVSRIDPSSAMLVQSVVDHLKSTATAKRSSETGRANEAKRSRSAKRAPKQKGYFSYCLLRPPLPGDEYKAITAIARAMHKNASVEPCFQGSSQTVPYPRRDYESIIDYELAPGLSKAQGEQAMALLKSSKLPECQENDACALPIPYQVMEDRFATESRCKSRRVACGRTALAQGKPLTLGTEVDATDMWGIDCFVRQNLVSVLQANGVYSEELHTLYISRILMPVVNIQPDKLAHDILYSLQTIIAALRPSNEADAPGISVELLDQVRCIVRSCACEALSEAEVLRVTTKLLLIRQNFARENFRIHPKGVGVRCLAKDGLKPGTFVVEYLGELYPPWRWFEKQDAIKNAQRKLRFKPVLPDFYNIMLERHLDDPDGYNLLFVDPIVRGNYASRLCHSCDPNCATVVMVVNGKFKIAVYTLRPISYGEELTFDYSSVTEDENEFKASICLCGATKCRGAFLYYAGLGAFADVINAEHTLIERTALIVNACTSTELSEDNLARLDRNGLRNSALQGLPEWLKKWTALVLEFVEYECDQLAAKLVEQKNTVTGEKLYTSEGALSEARGVLENRRQSLIITLNKLRYFLAHEANFKGNIQDAVPPLRRLSSREAADLLWNRNDSRVAEGLQILLNLADSLADATPEETAAFHRIRILMEQRRASPAETLDGAKLIFKEIRSLLWKLKPRAGFRYDAAGDTLSWYIYTCHYFTLNGYCGIRSDKIEIRNVDIGRDGCVVQSQASTKSVTKPPPNGFKVRLKRLPDEAGASRYFALSSEKKHYRVRLKRQLNEEGHEGYRALQTKTTPVNTAAEEWFKLDQDGGQVEVHGVEKGNILRFNVTPTGQITKLAEDEKAGDSSFYAFATSLPGCSKYVVCKSTADGTTAVYDESRGSLPASFKPEFTLFAFSSYVIGSCSIRVASCTDDAQVEIHVVSNKVWSSVKLKGLGKRVNPMRVVYDERKKYQAGFVWGQLSGWYKQTVSDPSASLSAERRGTISLPDFASCFGKGKNTYKDRKRIIEYATKTPHAMWPTGTIWSFRNKNKVYGSPWLDRVISMSSANLDKCIEEVQQHIAKP